MSAKKLKPKYITKQIRYTEDQIKRMLDRNMTSVQIRWCGVSPKRVARIARGGPGNHVGAIRNITINEEKCIFELVLFNPSIKGKDIQKKFNDHFGRTILNYR